MVKKINTLVQKLIQYTNTEKQDKLLIVWRELLKGRARTLGELIEEMAPLR